jgi:hypothetical protein
VGDVIGYAVDMRSAGCGIFSASVNGSFAANGTTFSGITALFLSPAMSGEHVSVLHAFHTKQL